MTRPNLRSIEPPIPLQQQWLDLDARHIALTAELRVVEAERKAIKKLILDELHMRGLSNDGMTAEIRRRRA